MQLSAKEAAARLGLDPKLLRKKLRDGAIPAYQVGVTWFVDSAVVDALQTGASQGSVRWHNVDVVHSEVDKQGQRATTPRPRYSGDYEDLAEWSGWVPFSVAAREIPRRPGVYIAREVRSQAIVYVGMAAERNGSGMRGRLAIYALGKGATSGLGEGAMDRALADIDWLKEVIGSAETGNPLRAKQFARSAIDRADLCIRWAETGDGPSALRLESLVIESFDGLPLWNRRR